MKKGFSLVDDILLEIAEEEGMSLTEIKDLWKHQKNYVKKQIEKEGVYAIFLPFIGTLSLNVKQFSKEIKGKKRNFYKDFIDKVNKLKKHENYTEKANSHKKVIGPNRLVRQIVKNYETNVSNKTKLIPIKDCWDIISKYSNGVFKIKNSK